MLDERRLARAVLPHDGHNLPLGEGGVDIFERVEAIREHFVQLMRRQKCLFGQLLCGGSRGELFLGKKRIQLLHGALHGIEHGNFRRIFAMAR